MFHFWKSYWYVYWIFWELFLSVLSNEILYSSHLHFAPFPLQSVVLKTIFLLYGTIKIANPTHLSSKKIFKKTKLFWRLQSTIILRLLNCTLWVCVSHAKKKCHPITHQQSCHHSFSQPSICCPYQMLSDCPSAGWSRFCNLQSPLWGGWERCPADQFAGSDRIQPVVAPMSTNSTSGCAQVHEFNHG